MEKGRCSRTREPLHRPFVAWNQVDAVIVAIGVPNRISGEFLPFLVRNKRDWSALA